MIKCIRYNCPQNIKNITKQLGVDLYTHVADWEEFKERYIKHIHRKFGSGNTKSFPVMGLFEYLYYTFIKRIRQERILYYIPYNEKEVIELITKELKWQDYGGKHHESKYTAFFQSYILTRKFKIDKRKLHYSSQINSGQLTREQALEKVRTDPYPGGEELLDYCLKKLDFTKEEFE